MLTGVCFSVSVTYAADPTEFCGAVGMRPQPFLSLWRNASLSVTCNTSRIVSRRKFGSGLPHIKDQNRATLFNETVPKSGKRKWEVGFYRHRIKYNKNSSAATANHFDMVPPQEWEYIMIPTCAVSALILFVVMPLKPDTGILVRPPLYHPISLTAVKDVVLRLNFSFDLTIGVDHPQRLFSISVLGTQ